jgi:alcohol dehydrogenase class IV
MSHAVGGVCNTVHGESLAAMTTSAIRHSMTSSPQKYKNIGAWLKGFDTTPEDWKLEQTVDAVDEVIRDIGMKIPLSVQGVKRSDFDEIIKGTTGYMGGGCDLDPAAPISADVVRKILEESY